MRFERLAVEIPSGKSHIHKVERFIEEICDKYHIGNELYGNITAALMEAVENAMVHGNNLDESKKITIRFEAKPGELIFHIQDQGKGFDHKHVIDPTDTLVSSDGISGRGLFIIRKLADTIRFNKSGNTVELHFNSTGMNDLIEIERRRQMETYLKKTQIHSKKQH